MGRRWSTLTDAATLDAAGAELPEHISRHAISSTENLSILTVIYAIVVLSFNGTHQGCALATHGACLPYHIKLHEVQLRHPSIRMIVYGDDTTAHGTGKWLYGRRSGGLLSWREDKERRPPLATRASRTR